jgi:uncharacterized protein
VADATPKFQILCLSGGGYLGLYTARVLAALEAETGEPLGRRFDLIAGTSIGGILALALAYEVPMARLVETFAARGKEIFSAREVPKRSVQRLRELGKGLAKPRHRAEPLRTLVREFLGDATLRDARHAVVIPAIAATEGGAKLFRTTDADVRAVDVALATSAAPLFFPLARIGADLFVDSGVFANAPDVIALHEAEHRAHVPRAAISVLSVGTTSAAYALPADTPTDTGTIGWGLNNRLLYTMMAAQQQLTATMMAESLGPRYLRIDHPNPPDAWNTLGIDIASPAARDMLLRLGDASAREALASGALKPFLAHRAPSR